MLSLKSIYLVPVWFQTDSSFCISKSFTKFYQMQKCCSTIAGKDHHEKGQGNSSNVTKVGNMGFSPKINICMHIKRKLMSTNNKEKLIEDG